jgi:carboxypeptidase Taq
LRYEIEKDLIEGKISVNELPEIWNEKMKKYLGIEPKNYSEGVLQDIHWSLGYIGYFPTYSIGTLLAAQLKYYIEDLAENIENGNFYYIREFLKEKIHKWGSIYSPKELLKKNFGEELKAEYFIKYLKEKYKK